MGAWFEIFASWSIFDQVMLLIRSTILQTKKTRMLCITSLQSQKRCDYFKISTYPNYDDCIELIPVIFLPIHNLPLSEQNVLLEWMDTHYHFAEGLLLSFA